MPIHETVREAPKRKQKECGKEQKQKELDPWKTRQSKDREAQEERNATSHAPLMPPVGLTDGNVVRWGEACSATLAQDTAERFRRWIPAAPDLECVLYEQRMREWGRSSVPLS